MDEPEFSFDAALAELEAAKVAAEIAWSTPVWLVIIGDHGWRGPSLRGAFANAYEDWKSGR